ncbi:MAG TPA: hypothetical protein VGT01_03725 [Candidatus Dormibacteraeota bacterium]|nr:hypothetical protein [Candidatus Dormibacteraeota bacterium]HEV2477901.1 hypothetical protein [Candidatus Dormibacteraeota bacterium]
MSENCRYYAEKVEAKRRARRAGPLRDQLAELMATVGRCEHIWAVEERVERSL